MRLRIPAWTKSASVKINGRAIDVTPTPGSYLTLNRAWKAGDKIEMTLPMHLSVEAMPDDPKTQAFLYGPLVLAGDLGSEGLDRAVDRRPERAPHARECRSKSRPSRLPGADPASWIKPAGAPLTFPHHGPAKDVTLVAAQQHFRQALLGLLAGFVVSRNYS